MKRISIILLIIVGVVCCIYCCSNNKSMFNVSFATEAYICNDGEKRIVNDNDVDELKRVLEGKLYADNPSCGFSDNVSIIFFNENESVTICPALDGCDVMFVKEVNKYFNVSARERESLNNVLEFYGIKFPAV